jgi:hypothetical protein
MSKLPVPSNRIKPAYRLNYPTSSNGLQGSATATAPTATITNGQTYSEVVCTAGAAKVRVRILCAGSAAGTLTVSPIAPEGLVASDESVMAANGRIDPAKIRAYTTGASSATAVAAVTETKVDLDLYGENYCLVSFLASGTGTLVFCDISTV